VHDRMHAGQHTSAANVKVEVRASRCMACLRCSAGSLASLPLCRASANAASKSPLSAAYSIAPSSRPALRSAATLAAEPRFSSTSRCTAHAYATCSHQCAIAPACLIALCFYIHFLMRKHTHGIAHVIGKVTI
jgi:hypothetical protein